MPQPPFATTARGIPYWEYVVDGFSETTSADGGFEATRILYCAWADRLRFRMDLVGWPELLNGGKFLSRHLPEQYPDIGGVYCTEAKLFQGKGVPNYDPVTGLIRFDDMVPGGARPAVATGKAFFQTTWRQPTYAILSDDAVAGNEMARFVTRQTEFAGDSQQLNGNVFKFCVPLNAVDLGQPIPAQVSRFRPTKLVTYTWHQVPGISPDGTMVRALEANIRACQGRVNSVIFDNVGEQWSAHTMLFLGVKKHRLSSPHPNLIPCLYDLELSFLFRDDDAYSGGHLKLPRGNAWEEVSVDGVAGAGDYSDGKKPYNSTDLERMFKFT